MHNNLIQELLVPVVTACVFIEGRGLTEEPSFFVFTAAKIQVEVFSIVMPCSVVVEYHFFFQGNMLPPS
jgi:hypothetical protein